MANIKIEKSVAGAADVFDSNLNKDQQTINAAVQEQLGGITDAMFSKIVVNLETIVNENKTSGSDLAGVTVSVTNTTDSLSPVTKTVAAGESSVTFDLLESGKDYEISVTALTGYATPATQTITSITKGSTVTKTMQYTADEYTVAITSNQGSGDTAIADAKVTIAGTQLGNGESIRVASGTVINPTATDVESYSKEITVVGKTVTAAYSTTVYTVAITSNQESDSVIAAKTVSVSYTGIAIAVVKANGESINVPSALTPEARAEDVTGYSKTVTVDTTLHTITVAYATEIVSVSLTKDQGDGDLTGVAISVLDSNDVELGSGTGSISGLKVAGGTVYHIALSDNPSGYTVPDVTATYTAAVTTNASRSISLEYTEITEVAVSSYIINQTNPSAAAADMIEIDIPAKDNNDNDSVIHRIHTNTKLYGSTGLSGGSLQVKEIDRGNKALFTDGTTVTSSYDVFMKLPEFWWKVTELATDRYQISFTMDSTTGSGTGWNHWEGNTFIGCYEAYESGNLTYSRSGVTPTVNVSQENFKSHARARGTGYQIVTYEAHSIMCLLGYGWLGTTDDQSVVGYGSTNYRKTTGLCNSKGINDTSANVDGGSSSNNSASTSINFWGLENWWGDLYEWVDNIETTGSGGIKVMDINGNTVRTATAGTTSSDCIGKMVLGVYGDTIPKEVHSDGNYTTGFASYGYVYGSAGYVALRACGGAEPNGGLGYLRVASSSSSADSAFGSRLLYKGSFNVINN